MGEEPGEDHQQGSPAGPAPRYWQQRAHAELHHLGERDSTSFFNRLAFALMKINAWQGKSKQAYIEDTIITCVILLQESPALSVASGREITEL